MKLKLLLSLIIIIMAVLVTSCGNTADETTLPDSTETDPVETEPVETVAAETEPPHTHEYKLSNTVAGTCVEEGYETYSCTCGLSYKNLIPSAHKYKSVKDTTGKYVKNVCTLCGDYKIVRNQSYVHYITFDACDTVEDAVNAFNTLKFYAISSADGMGGKGVIKSNLDGKYMYINDSNFYIEDTSGTLLTKKFVVSIDVKFDKYTNIEMISFAHQKQSGWNYNSGIVKVTADGKIKIHGDDTPLDVKLSEKGYTNLTVVCDPISTLCDIYVNEKLVKKDVKYFAIPKDVKAAYIRYFDRKPGYAASADNIKLYVADTPEFVVPDGLVFKD